jgi:hypothetical protein
MPSTGDPPFGIVPLLTALKYSMILESCVANALIVATISSNAVSFAASVAFSFSGIINGIRM